MVHRALLAVLLLLPLSACSDCCTEVVSEPAPRAVELEIEVYDPFTGGVWEGVGVRVVQALPGQDVGAAREAGCDRQLQLRDGRWQVAPLAS